MTRVLEIRAWLLAALLVGILALMAMLVPMMHVHGGDVAYITRSHRPIIFEPAPAPLVLSA